MKSISSVVPPTFNGQRSAQVAVDVFFVKRAQALSFLSAKNQKGFWFFLRVSSLLLDQSHSVVN